MMLSGRDAEQGRDFTLYPHTLSPYLHGQGRLPAEGRVRLEGYASVCGALATRRRAMAW